MSEKEAYRHKPIVIEPIEHELKILPQFYNGVSSQRKTFEIRKDDRDYQVGDIIVLREFDGKEYTGHMTKRIITYILRDAKEYGLEDGYCILGIQPIGWDYIHQTTVIQSGANCTHINNVGTLNL